MEFTLMSKVLKKGKTPRMVIVPAEGIQGRVEMSKHIDEGYKIIGMINVSDKFTEQELTEGIGHDYKEKVDEIRALVDGIHRMTAAE